MKGVGVCSIRTRLCHEPISAVHAAPSLSNLETVVEKLLILTPC